MTIHHFFADVLNSIADAQYRSYVFSQSIGEQATDSLFPIPIAEIKEITFDINFAYLNQQDSDSTELLPLNFYNRAEHTFSAILAKVLRTIVDEADLIDLPSDIDWSGIKRSLLQNKLQPLFLAAVKKAFLAEPVVQENTLNISLLRNSLIKVTTDLLSVHPQLKWLNRYFNMRLIIDKNISDMITAYKDEWLECAEEARTQKMQSGDIIIDATRLKELPTAAIQQARVVLDVRNILKQNE